MMCRVRYSKHSALPRWRNSRNNPAWARRAALRILGKLRQRTENGDASWRADVDFPVDDHGRDELVATEVVTVIGGLIGIVEFLGEISGVVSKKNGAGVFNGPDDSVGGAVGGDARSRPGISEMMRALRRRSCCEPRGGHGKRFQRIADRSVVHRVIEKRGHGKDTAAQLPGNLLIDLIRGGVELAHGIAIHHVDDRIFTGADGQVPRVAARIRNVQEQYSSAGTEVSVGIRFRAGIVRSEIIGKLQSAGSGKLHEAVATIAVRRKTAGVQGGIEIAVS